MIDNGEAGAWAAASGCLGTALFVVRLVFLCAFCWVSILHGIETGSVAPFVYALLAYLLFFPRFQGAPPRG